MELGNFSISLAVKDIEKSRIFYEKLGFTIFGGDQTQNWLILKNRDHCIGLFQGMFEDNILTFNPGWNSDAKELGSFTDIRDIHKVLKAEGIKTENESFTADSGPASFTLTDPDGNAIMLDQHI